MGSSRAASISRSPAVLSPVHLGSRAQAKPTTVAYNNWKTFGPSQSWSDGDADYFQLTNKLSQQYEWFAPRPDAQPQEVVEPQEQEQQEMSRPEFGLSPKQIAALGLAGPRANLPDPVSSNRYVFVRSCQSVLMLF